MPMMNQIDKTRLVRNTSFIVTNLADIANILDHLVQNEAIPDREYDEIKVMPTRHEKAQALVELIKRSGQIAYDSFMEALGGNQKHIAEEILKDFGDDRQSASGKTTSKVTVDSDTKHGYTASAEGDSDSQPEMLNPSDKEGLQRNRKDIINKTSYPENILLHLVSNDAIAPALQEEINATPTTSGKMTKLLDFLIKGSQGTFDVAIGAMAEHDGHVVVLIRKTAEEHCKQMLTDPIPENAENPRENDGKESERMQHENLEAGMLNLSLDKDKHDGVDIDNDSHPMQSKSLNIGLGKLLNEEDTSDRYDIGQTTPSMAPAGGPDPVGEKEQVLDQIIKDSNWGERVKLPQYAAEKLTLPLRSLTTEQIWKLRADYEDGSVRKKFLEQYVNTFHPKVDYDDVLVEISQKELHSVNVFLESRKHSEQITWTYCQKNTRWYWKFSAGGFSWQTTETAVAVNNGKCLKPQTSDVKKIQDRFYGRLSKPEESAACEICNGHGAGRDGKCHPTAIERHRENFYAFDGINISILWEKRLVAWDTIANTGDEAERNSSIRRKSSAPAGKERQDGAHTDPYTLNNKVKGLACIITMHKYLDDSDGSQTLHGYSDDTEDLKKLWKNRGFIVKIPRRKTARGCLRADEIKIAVQEFAGQLTRSDQCAILCLLSHGGYGFVHGSDGEKVYLADLLNELNNENCIQMAKKPKLIIVQACQGGERDTGQVVPAGADPVIRPPEVESVIHIPTFSDFIVCTSSFQGFVSFVSPKKGSTYIQTLVDILNKNPDTEDIDTILRMVNYTMAETTVQYEYTERKHGPKFISNQKQMSESRSSLRKQLFLCSQGEGSGAKKIDLTIDTGIVGAVNERHA